MKRIILVLAALALAGCGTPTIVIQDDTPTDTEIVGYADYETDYIDYIRSHETAAELVSDEDLLSTGNSICAFLDGGGSAYEAIRIAETAVENSGGEGDLVYRTLAAAVTFICPQYRDDLERAVS